MTLPVIHFHEPSAQFQGWPKHHHHQVPPPEDVEFHPTQDRPVNFIAM